MKLLRPVICFAAFAATAPSWAADYAFDVIYLGSGVAELAPGSTDPRSVTLEANDTFTWAISAQPGHRWSVLSDSDVFPFMALGVNETARRVSNHTLTLSYQSSTTLMQSWSGDTQSFVHMGTNTVTLPTGLVFDRLVLDYTLLSATEVISVEDPDNPGEFIDQDGGPIGSTPNGLLPIFGMVDTNFSTVIYAPVPEPATWALWLVGLAGAGVAARRSRQS